MSKRLTVLLSIVLVVVVGGTVAYAQTDSEAGTVLRGKGSLKASGSGSVNIEMSGVLALAADGDVTILDNSGDARVHILSHGDREAGANELTGESSYELSGFQGIVRVVGSDFAVETAGFTALRARGSGSAELNGDGVWKTRADWGFWTENGVRLHLEP
ncbi:MAG: hypothetical protein HKN80_10775 [Acidimicrobiia bacterium]|nr:hypothetical protein [Acidimicrobiia bacterium]